ncbi:Gfo/Idh/MocA family protein [Frondihabitans australicus]|uniref:Putative dehydrogenase n=1 Tax=Frondihabitans australicus TaxID=386892 RepID=A0A495IHI6_9MICO|nr:Gfo/Idh/MocA family oxidoreductase [Frondihabitans australicus]RKR75160.1 putative dehydrogenase [Frondihabitans australicus]
MTTTLPRPRDTDLHDSPILRWGIIAPGRIATDWADSVLRHTSQRIVAVGSRSAERAQAFAARHGIERAYGSYDELVHDAEVDVVYIASPHSEHEAQALLAIAAGKHVLIEKPIATTAASAQRIVDAARAAGVFAMEAMWTRYRPQSDVVRQVLERGDLGEVRVVTAAFNGLAEFDASSRLWDPALAGGALLDLGVYPASYGSFVLGSPTRVLASGDLAPSGVDRQAAMILEHAGGAQAVLTTGLNARTPEAAMIAGSEGRLEIPSPFWFADDLRLVDSDGQVVDTWHDPFGRTARESLCCQAVALARYVGEGRTESPLHTLDETVAVMATLDEARYQLG